MDGPLTSFIVAVQIRRDMKEGQLSSLKNLLFLKCSPLRNERAPSIRKKWSFFNYVGKIGARYVGGTGNVNGMQISPYKNPLLAMSTWVGRSSIMSKLWST